MGREAVCACQWDQTSADVTALLESGELILRGGIRRKIAFRDMRQIRANGENLCFTVGADSVSLTLGSAAAVKWARAIVTPPPTLADKLGITAETTVQLLGPLDDGALKTALAQAAKVSPLEGHVILARVDSPQELDAILQKTSASLARGVPIWVIYPKGPGHALSESSVINRVRARDMTDTKVASISSRLTGLRFIKRKS